MEVELQSIHTVGWAKKVLDIYALKRTNISTDGENIPVRLDFLLNFKKNSKLRIKIAGKKYVLIKNVINLEPLSIKLSFFIRHLCRAQNLLLKTAQNFVYNLD